MLDDITPHWLTNTGTSSARLYWENDANNFNAVDVSIPAAVTVFPGELDRAPLSWCERGGLKAPTRWKGGHLHHALRNPSSKELGNGRADHTF
jgi:hypothetical protein